MDQKAYCAAVDHMRAARQRLHDATKGDAVTPEEAIFMEPYNRDLMQLVEALEDAQRFLQTRGLLH